jgi:hypothetical protein
MLTFSTIFYFFVSWKIPRIEYLLYTGHVSEPSESRYITLYKFFVKYTLYEYRSKFFLQHKCSTVTFSLSQLSKYIVVIAQVVTVVV